MEKLLTIEELAERWQCDVRTIERLKSNKKDPNKLQETKIRSLVRFKLENIEEFERTHSKNSYFDLAQPDAIPIMLELTDEQIAKLLQVGDWLDEVQHLPRTPFE